MAFCTKCGVSLEGRFCSVCGHDNQSGEKILNCDDTIKKLYSLRAGLSSVSLQKDNIKGYEKDFDRRIGNEETRIKNAETDYDTKQKQISYMKEKIRDVELRNRSNILRSFDEAEKEELRQIEKENKSIERKNSISKIKISSIVGIGALLTVLGPVLLIIFVVFYESIDHPLLFWFLGPWSDIFYTVLGIGTLKDAYDMRKKQTLVPLKYKDSVINKYNEKRENVLLEERTSRRYKDDLPNQEAQLEECLNKIENQKSVRASLCKEKKDSLKYYSGCALATYNALVSEHSSLLDVRDWQNLDLVIYYLETGRAISIREALQLVDRQRQTDAIVSALGIASQQIRDTIIERTQQLESSIIKCSQVLSAQLSDISFSLNKIERNQSISQNYLKDLSNEIAISNALKAKANKTSAQLMDDVKQIRIYAENYAIKARNS